MVTNSCFNFVFNTAAEFFPAVNFSPPTMVQKDVSAHALKNPVLFLQPPNVTCLTRLWHPNINETGEVCLR